VSVVVIDGVTVGHPCCGVSNCKIPLENNHHRFCPAHYALNQSCAVVGCTHPIIPGKKTCALPDHQAVENVHNDRGQARFQLKDRLRRAQLAHPRDALPVEVTNISELVEDENMEENFDFDRKGLPILATTIPTNGPATTTKIRAQFGRKRTHNEQLFVAPCGMIIARETFYHAEAIYSVIVSFQSFNLIKDILRDSVNRR